MDNNNIFYLVFIAIVAYAVLRILAELAKYIVAFVIVGFLLFNFNGQLGGNPNVQLVENTTETVVVDDPISHDDIVGEWATENGTPFIFNANRTVKIGAKLDGTWKLRQSHWLHINLHGIRENLVVHSFSQSKMVLKRENTTKSDIVLFKKNENVSSTTN